MKCLPLICTRPADETGLHPGALSRAYLTELLQRGIYVEERDRAFYVRELRDAYTGYARRGLIAACAVGECLVGKAEALAPGAVPQVDGDAASVRDGILALGCQNRPVPLAMPGDSVLGVILDAATAATPLYALENGTLSLRVWEVRRRDSIDALREMIGRVDPADVALLDTPLASGALAAAVALRDEARSKGALTGREPFNWFMAELFADAGVAGAASGLAPAFPSNLLLHRVAPRG